MSTHATITLKTKEGTYKSIYLHFDGHPEEAGEILTAYYTTYEKVEELINLGDLSILEKSAGCPDGHCFDSKVNGFCVAYGRDRGEQNTEANEYTTYEEVIEDMGQDFNYLFQDGAWSVSGYDQEEVTWDNEISG